MPKAYFRGLIILLLVLMMAGCGNPWVKVPADTRIYSMLDIPMNELRTNASKMAGTVFEDRFKFYRIYHGRDTADLAKRGQVTAGKTHFTARPLHQYLQAIRIRITPAQEKWIRKAGIERQDVVEARIRFAELLQDGTLAFELLEIVGT